MSTEIELSIVVPCYNEEQGVAELIKRCDAAARKSFDTRFEIVLVDDGSRDATWSTIRAFLKQNSNLVGIRLSRNYGHQLALTAGLSKVRGELVLVIDADLQDPPELLAEMLATMRKESADVVFGQRRSREGETWFKQMSASFFYRILLKLTDVSIPVDAGDFRLMTRRVSDLLVSMPERDRFIRGMVAWLGFKQVPFLYDRKSRFAGNTKYPFTKMVRFALDGFLGYSMTLLRLSGILASLLLIGLLLIGLHAVYSWLYLDVAPGWTSTTILLIVVSFSQLLVLSILGEYIGRIYMSTKGRPLFVIETIQLGGPNA